MSNGISASQTSQSPLHLRISDGNLPAVLGTFQFEAQIAVLQPSATNYVFLDLSQNPPALVVNQSGFPASDVWTIATAVTNDTKIMQLMDSRPAFNSSAFAGGGGTPGGADTQLQYNNAGTFGGIAESTYIPGTVLAITGATIQFALAIGPTGDNDLIVGPSGISATASESGATLGLGADADITINSANGSINATCTGNVTFGGNGDAQFSAGVSITFSVSGSTKHYNFASLPVFANNAAALAGNLNVGDLYRTGANPDPVFVVH